MKNNKMRSILALALCAATLAFNSAAVFAAASPSTASQELKISPVRSDITVAAGTTGTVKIILTNITKNSLTVQPIENDFVASGEQGRAALILNPNSYAPSHSLKRFMVPLSNVTLPPNGSQQITVTIDVPKNAQAGGYFGALRFSPVIGGVKSNATAVSIGESVASLILMTVPGPTTEQLTLTDFDIQQNGGTASNFRTPNNLSVLLRFENKGNLQEAPFGQIDVQKGKKVLYTYNFNQTQPKNEILPDSFRRWSIPLKGLGKFGKYTITGTFAYGSSGQTIEIQKSVWIIPSGYIITALILLAVLVAACAGAYLFLKSYKKRILKSSRRRY